MRQQHILDDIHDFIGRFIAYPNEHARVAHTLWIAHTHLIDAFYTTPRLAILSAERRCGKTTLVRITKLLAQNAISIVSPSPAALYTLIEYSDVLPTLLLDEIDRTYERKETADMTAIVDSGFQADQTVPRVSLEPKRHVEYFKVFCPMLLALLWQIYSCCCSLQIHFRQCGHRCGGSRAKSSRMAWRTAGNVG